jgi:CHAT domain-containing protein
VFLLNGQTLITDRTHLLAVYNDIAKACLQKYNEQPAQKLWLDRGISAYDSLLVLLNVIRSGYLTEDAKIELASKSQEVLKEAFAVYVQLAAKEKNTQFLEKAFQISEYCKAFALLEAAKINNFKNAVPLDLDLQEQRLLKEIDETDKKIYLSNSDSDEYDKLKKHRFDLFNQMAKLKVALKNNALSYWTLRYGGADLNVKDIQNLLLDQDQGLVEYFCTDTTTYVFVITKKDFSFYPIHLKLEELKKSIAQFQYHLSKPINTSVKIKDLHYDTLFQKGNELYTQLIAQISTELPARLILIPDSPISDLAFEALVTHKNIQTPSQALEQSAYLLHKYATSYCFSANLLYEMKKNQLPKYSRRKVAVFAATYADKISPPKGVYFPWSPFLSPMGLNQINLVANLKEVVKTIIYEGPKASRQNLILAAQKARYGHVIAHGFVDEQNPNLSCIVFSQPKQVLDTSNVLLMNDFYHLKLPFEVLGFSSCQTAVGPYLSGEGKKSMARSLTFSGVRSFLATLWSIQLNGATQTVPNFFEKMLCSKEKIPKDVALTKAKIDFLNANQLSSFVIHPGNWAGTILIGATDYQQDSAAIPTYILLLLGSALLIFVVWMVLNKKKLKPSKAI